MKILLGWELGAGQGHIHRLAKLASKLEAYGVEPVFALKSYNIKGLSFPWQVVFAPQLPFSGRSESYTYTDILETFGFGEETTLSAHIQAWQTALTEIKPKLIIADHAPGLVLAAYNRIPTVVVGGGFTVPPLEENFPPLQFPVPLSSESRRTQVINTIRQVTKLDVSIGKVLNGDVSYIFSIPELDPYRHLRYNQQYVSLLEAPIATDLYKQDGNAWAYLSDDYPHRNLVLQSLSAESEFQALHEALAEKSLAIHHGSLTTALACLLTGIPQLLLPRHLEEYLNCIALSGLGVAKTITKPTWESLISAQAQVSGLAVNAKQQAANLASWNQNFLGIVIKTCVSYVI